MRWVAAGLLALSPLLLSPVVQAQSQLSPGFVAGEEDLTPSERAGREIWFKATAGNDRFHTYVFPQRLGVLIDWDEVLNATTATSASRPGASSTTPTAARPATRTARRQSLDETYGFDYCPGDDDLLATSARRAIAIRPATSTMRRCDPAGPHGDAISARARATSRSAPRPARSASASFPIRASTPSLARPERRRSARGRGIAPSAYRDDAGARLADQSPARRVDRAAVPDRHVVRRVPHRVQSAEAAGRSRASRVGKHRRARSAISTAASPRFSPRACRAQPRMADRSRTRARARSTRRRCRTTRSAIPAR